MTSITKLTGILAVAGTSLVGAAFVLVAMHFRDSAEVPHWTPPSASLAPMMAGFAEPPPQVAPRTVAAPVLAPKPIPPPAPVVAEAPTPPPPPPAMPPPPTPFPVVEPAHAAEPDDEEDVAQAQAEQVAAMKANKLRTLDMRAKRMMNHPRFNPGANLVNPAAPQLR